jgi:hypothetical protein
LFGVLDACGPRPPAAPSKLEAPQTPAASVSGTAAVVVPAASSKPAPEGASQPSEKPDAGNVALKPSFDLPTLSLEARSANITAKVVVPSVFFDLPACPPGATRTDTRQNGYGDVACRSADGVLDGPYASNIQAPDRNLPGGVSERGEYRHGARAGLWYRMKWGMGAATYYAVTYADGRITSEHELIAHGASADACRRRCTEQAKGCNAAQMACPPGAPCMHRNCEGDQLSCDAECAVVRVAPWQEASKNPELHPTPPACDCASNACVCSGMPALMRCAAVCNCPRCPAGIP